MSKILKIKIDDVVDFPIRSKILNVLEQDYTFYAYVICDGDEELTDKRRFLIVGTDKEFNRNGWDYLTSIVCSQRRDFAWHIFTQWGGDE